MEAKPIPECAASADSGQRQADAVEHLGLCAGTVINKEKHPQWILWGSPNLAVSIDALQWALPASFSPHGNHHTPVGMAGVSPRATVPGAGSHSAEPFFPPLCLFRLHCDTVERLAVESEKPGFNSWLHHLSARWL